MILGSPSPARAQFALEGLRLNRQNRQKPRLSTGIILGKKSKNPTISTKVAERFVVPLKPGNSGEGKGPQFKTDAIRSEGPGDWETYQLR